MHCRMALGDSGCPECGGAGSPVGGFCPRGMPRDASWDARCSECGGPDAWWPGMAECRKPRRSLPKGMMKLMI